MEEKRIAMALRLDKMLFIGSLCYFLAVLVWLKRPQDPTSNIAVKAVDSEFIDYLKASLVLISGSETIVADPEVLTPEVPEPKEVETVYVPIYQPPQIIIQESTPPPVVPPPPPGVTQEGTPPVVAEMERVLVGILESPTDMLALFEVNNETIQVTVGDEVINTGWYVQEIVDQEVWIEQLGVVKKLKVGQKF